MLFKIILDESSQIKYGLTKAAYFTINQQLLQKNDIEMYSTYNEGISVIIERSIKTLKNKIYQYMTSFSKNAYTDKQLTNAKIHITKQLK